MEREVEVMSPVDARKSGLRLVKSGLTLTPGVKLSLLGNAFVQEVRAILDVRPNKGRADGQPHG